LISKRFGVDSENLWITLLKTCRQELKGLDFEGPGPIAQQMSKNKTPMKSITWRSPANCQRESRSLRQEEHMALFLCISQEVKSEFLQKI
jgi:hypothetical protein